MMDSRKALETVIAAAAAYIENKVEGLGHGSKVATDTTDDQLAAWAKDDEFELEDYVEVRDYLRAAQTVEAILAQKGCEDFDPAGDGTLTDLMDIVVFG